MSENQWLELKLSELAKVGKRKVANIREEIIKMFPDRELVLMNHPLVVGQEGDVGDLEEIGPENLGEEFTNDIRHLRAKILNDTPVKQIWSRKITGNTLAFLLSEYV